MIAQGLFAAVVLFLLVDIRRRQGLREGGSTNPSIVMDTSALIDGRVVEIIKAGFLVGNIIVSKKVLDELQLLADGRDSHKRERARYGLDVINELQKLKNTAVDIDNYMANSDVATDECILRLAKKHNARLCTTDYNLNKVASVEGVNVLNVNELAQALRPKALPGESVEVKIIQKGESKTQGVGYLDDGTMVVVDNAGKMKNKKVKATVERMIQTKAGKMVFAVYVDPRSNSRK